MIRQRLAKLTEMTGGYDFADVVARYWQGHDTGDEQLTSAAVRWLRGEFTTRTDARAALGVRTIIDDASFYDHLNLLSIFVTFAGYDGLLVCLDEMVNLYKLANTQARNANYEQILRIVNDSLQGSAAHLGSLFAGTPDFLLDTRRGLYSYPALQSRLAENSFATGGLVDHSGPVLRLANLSPEDFYVLLIKLRHVYAAGEEDAYLVPDEALHAYMQHCAQRLGTRSTAHHATPSPDSSISSPCWSRTQIPTGACISITSISPSTSTPTWNPWSTQVTRTMTSPLSGSDAARARQPTKRCTPASGDGSTSKAGGGCTRRRSAGHHRSLPELRT